MRDEIDEEVIAHVLFQMGKRAVAEKRRRAQVERDRRQKDTNLEG
jgi:hypothetical protein